MEDEYYVESYDPKGTKTKEHWTYSDGAEALDCVRAIIAQGDVARIRCPPSADPEYIRMLQKLGAEQF